MGPYYFLAKFLNEDNKSFFYYSVFAFKKLINQGAFSRSIKDCQGKYNLLFSRRDSFIELFPVSTSEVLIPVGGQPPAYFFK